MPDHHLAVTAAICMPPLDWKRPPGRPNHTWLIAIELDLRLLNIGPSYAWKKAASREHWHSITVDTAIVEQREHKEREIALIQNESKKLHP